MFRSLSSCCRVIDLVVLEPGNSSIAESCGDVGEIGIFLCLTDKALTLVATASDARDSKLLRGLLVVSCLTGDGLAVTAAVMTLTLAALNESSSYSTSGMAIAFMALLYCSSTDFLSSNGSAQRSSLRVTEGLEGLRGDEEFS